MSMMKDTDTLHRECARLRALAEQVIALSEEAPQFDYRLGRIAELILDSEDAIARVLGE